MRYPKFWTLAALVFTTCVQAQNEKKAPEQVRRTIQAGPQGMLRRFDKNNDGQLTRAEVPERMKRGFARLDRNNDGRLNRQELATFIENLRRQYGLKRPANDQPNPQVAQQFRRMMQQLDKDKDGKISRKEAEGRPQLSRNFDRLDTNRDGSLERAELARVIAAAVRAQQNGNRQGRPGARPQAVDFDDFDRNADGRLTREELARTRFASQFEALDTDKSGKIDHKEFEAGLKK